MILSANNENRGEFEQVDVKLRVVLELVVLDVPVVEQVEVVVVDHLLGLDPELALREVIEAREPVVRTTGSATMLDVEVIGIMRACMMKLFDSSNSNCISTESSLHCSIDSLLIFCAIAA